MPLLRAFPSSFRLRIVALYVVVFGATVFGFAGVLYFAFVHNHQREFDAGLFNYVVDVAHAIDPTALAKGNVVPQVLKVEEEKILPFALGETLLEISTMDGRPLAHSNSLIGRSLPRPELSPERLRKRRTVFDDIVAPGGPDGGRGRYRRVIHLKTDVAGREFVIQVAVPMLLLEREKEGLLAFFAISIPIVLILATLGGLWLSGHAMQPFTAIIAKAREIRADQLSERVPVPRSRDEIRELAETLNGLLDRLERAFRSQEAFIADASHQLKTPLSIMSGEIELMQARTGDDKTVRDFLDSAGQEVQHLAKMVEDLLLLARVDGGLEDVAVQPIRLDEVAMEAAARLERFANRRGARFLVSLSPGETDAFELAGDPQLLRCLIENLLENAIKYSPSGEAVAVSLFDRGDQLSLEVRDRGPGIPDVALSRIFNRFYRAETTRDKVSGSGLGLSLVKKVAELHGGIVHASNHAEGGAVFTVDLPKRPPAPPAFPLA